MSKNNLTVDKIMSSKLITLHPKDKLKRAKEIFDQYKIHHLPIEVMGDVRGIISLGDILFLEGVVNSSFDEFIRSKQYSHMTVDEVMTSNPYCLDVKQKASDALDIMIDKRINAIPVKSEDKLVGIITHRDLLEHLRKVITE